MTRGGRMRRVADQVQRELSTILARDMKDPRVALVTLTAVEVSPDCAHAKIYFTCLDPEQVEMVAGALGHAAGFLRARLAERLRLYTVPSLHFHYDRSIERGARLSSLIDSVTGPRKD